MDQKSKYLKYLTINDVRNLMDKKCIICEIQIDKCRCNKDDNIYIKYFYKMQKSIISKIIKK